MIDLHCHFLHNVDDGARDIDEALQLARIAVDNGITHSVLTPHIHLRRYPNCKQTLAEPYKEYQSALTKEGVGLKVALASEVRMAPELLMGDAWKKLPSIGRDESGNSALLLEMPYSHVPAGTEQLLRWLVSQGVRPIIAHPERNREIIKRPPLALSLKSAGAYLQGTLSAFTGSFGEEVEAVAWELLHHGAYYCLASDSHRVNKRPPTVLKSIQKLENEVGTEQVEALTKTRPWALAQSLFTDAH